MSIKVTFGLQPSHIELIEGECKRWKEEHDAPNPLFIEYFWERIGKQIRWHPFTLALYYFRHLDKTSPITIKIDDSLQ